MAKYIYITATNQNRGMTLGYVLRGKMLIHRASVLHTGPPAQVSEKLRRIRAPRHRDG